MLYLMLTIKVLAGFQPLGLKLFGERMWHNIYIFGFSLDRHMILYALAFSL